MTPAIGVVMGSSSDWDTMQHAADILREFGIAFETQVVSAHRMPDDMFRYAEQARAQILKIPGAGKVEVADLSTKVAAMLGTTADQIAINDVAVNPISGSVYMSVSRGLGAEAKPVVVILPWDEYRLYMKPWGLPALQAP